MFFAIAFKSLKKICKLQQRKFWDKCNDDFEANQHSNSCNAWKKCDENISTETPLIEVPLHAMIT